MIIITNKKIAKLIFSDEKNENQQNEDEKNEDALQDDGQQSILEEKLSIIHRIMNGEKQKIKKPKVALFSFGKKPDEKGEEENAD